MPTYGMICYCLAFSSQQIPLPMVYWLVACIGTFVITAFIPLTLILFFKRRGAISDFSISKAQERTQIYWFTILCYAFWIYFTFKIIHTPFVAMVGIWATIALVLVTLINYRWKISAHLTGLGGLLGGILAYTYNYAQPLPIITITILLVVALLLMYARLYLNAHTPGQVVAGFLLGIIMTVGPVYLSLYA